MTVSDKDICFRCKMPNWSHNLWTCIPNETLGYIEDDDMRREVVLRELNQGALAGMDSKVTEHAVDMVLAVLNRFDEWARDREVS